MVGAQDIYPQPLEICSLIMRTQGITLSYNRIIAHRVLACAPGDPTDDRRWNQRSKKATTMSLLSSWRRTSDPTWTFTELRSTEEEAREEGTFWTLPSCVFSATRQVRKDVRLV